MGTEIYYHARELTLACLYLRKHGPPYLRALPMERIWSLLQDFIVDNYWHLFDETWAKPFDGTYADRVSASTKDILARQLAASSIFRPVAELTLYPLIPVKVAAPFRSELFSVVSPSTLVRGEIPTELEHWVEPDAFPPLTDWKGRRDVGVSSWLAVRSPVEDAADKVRAAILGAIALTPLPMYTYLFSGRRIFGGRCTISRDGGARTSFSAGHTPPMMHDIVVTEADHAWLSMLAEKLGSNTKTARRELRCLEYFYRAWPLGKSERFPILCMALDAVFGDANGATQAVIDGIQVALGSHLPDARLRRLMSLRAAVIHGGAPDVYDSSKYAEYYSEYGVDPIYDLELITAACLRARVFNGALVPHPDPNGEIVHEHQKTGRLPKQYLRPSILDVAGTQ